MSIIEKKLEVFNYIDAYQDQAFISRLKRKLSYFHKQLYIKYLIKSGTFNKLKVKIVTGQEMSIVLPDNISSSLYTSGFFETEETKGFISLMKEACTFLDIGSHIGYYSVLANHFGGPNSKVLSIEPTPSTFEILKENTNTPNGIQLNIALYSKQGKMSLNDYGYRYMSLNSVKDARLDTKIKGLKIDVIIDTLDNVVEKFNLKPDVIKIDAESAELEILKGAIKTISNYKPIFFIEVGDFESIDSNSSIKIIDYLASFNYLAYEYTDKFSIHQKRSDSYPSMSLFFFHESKINDVINK
jgi:FkbM family methyltransferase